MRGRGERLGGNLRLSPFFGDEGAGSNFVRDSLGEASGGRNTIREVRGLGSKKVGGRENSNYLLLLLEIVR